MNQIQLEMLPGIIAFGVFLIGFVYAMVKITTQQIEMDTLLKESYEFMRYEK